MVKKQKMNKMKKFLASLSIITMTGSGLVIANNTITNEANAANDTNNPYASSIITKDYDGTGQGTPDGTFINDKNGFFPGDNSPTDGVVASNDYVGYTVETRFQAGPERTVVVNFNAPEYLKFTSAKNPGICVSNSFVKGTPVTSGDKITGCSYFVQKGVGVTVQHALTATALDTAGEAVYDQVASVGTGLKDKDAYSKYDADAVTVVSAPTADLVLRPSTCTVAGSCWTQDSSNTTGYLEVMVDPLKWPGYNTIKGASTLGDWTAKLDVTAFPAGTIWTVGSTQVGTGGSTLNLGPYSGAKQIGFTVPDSTWGGEEFKDGEARSFDAHLIVPDTAFATDSYKNNGTGWEPGQDEPSGFNTFNDKDSGSRKGYIYANNDWTKINVYKEPVLPSKGTGLAFGKIQYRPWESSQTLWEDGNMIFSDANSTANTVNSSSYYWNKKSYNDTYTYWDMAPGTELLSQVFTSTEMVPDEQELSNVIISDQWDTNFVEADPNRQAFVTNAAGEKITSGFTMQWSLSVDGDKVINLSNNGWITTNKVLPGAKSVRVIFDTLPSGSDSDAGMFSLYVPTKIVETLDEPEIPEITSDLMYGWEDGCDDDCLEDQPLQVPVSIVTMGTPQLKIKVEANSETIPPETNKVGYTITPTVKDLISSEDTINGEITLTLDPCINDYTLPENSPWEIVSENMDLTCGDSGANTIVLKLKDNWKPANSFNQGTTTLPTISLDTTWSKLTTKAGAVSAEWSLSEIDGPQGEKIDQVSPVSDAVSVMPIPASVIGQKITTSTPKVEINDVLQYQGVIEASISGQKEVSANSTVIVMPGRGNDSEYRSQFDTFDGPEESNFDGTYVVSKAEVVAKDSIAGTTIECTTDVNPSFDPSVNTWGACTGSNLANATAIRVNQPGGEHQGISTVDIELTPTNNKTGDNYLMWIGPVTGVGITAGLSWPANDEVVSSTISGYTYWDVSGKGLDYRDGWPIQSDITVELLNSDGQVIDTTETDDAGYYEFGDLHSGKYFTQIPAIGANGGFPTTMPSAFYPDRTIKVEQTYSYRGQKLTNAKTVSSEIDLGVDATQANVNFGFTAPDPYSDLKKDAAKVRCSSDEVVCDVSWDITVKNGGTPYEPGEILGATGDYPAGDDGAAVWTTDGYFIVKSNGSVTKAQVTGTVLGATGDYPTRAYGSGVWTGAYGSGVWTSDGYYNVEADGSTTKAQGISGTILGATGAWPASSGSGVWTTDGYYIVDPDGSTTKTQGISGTILGATGIDPKSSYGSGVWTSDGYYIVEPYGSTTKAQGISGTILGATGATPADINVGSGVWTTDGYYIVDPDGSTTKAQGISGTILGATGAEPANIHVGSGVWTTDGYYIVDPDGSTTKTQGISGTILGATGIYPKSPYGSGVWTTDGYFIVKSDGSVTKAQVTGTVLGATGSNPAASDGSGVWTTDGYFIVKSDGSVTKTQVTGTVLGATGYDPAEVYGSGVWTTDDYFIVQSDGTVTKVDTLLPEAPEFTGTPVTLTGGKLTDSTSKEVYDVEAIIGERVKQVSVGYNHSLAVTDDGRVYAWGSNFYGQLGDGTTVDKHVPTEIAGLSNVKQVSAGTYHSLAVTDDGRVYAWGNNSYGQLGDGTTVNKSIPTEIAGLSNVKQVSAGTYHSLAVIDDGRVYAWGDNSSGQLGDGTTVNKSIPTEIAGLSNVKQVSAGSVYSLAVTDDGRVYAWGYNIDGQLGDGTTVDKNVPTEITGISNVKQVSAGSVYSLAVIDDGRVYAWGDNSYGQLGDGTIVNKHVPTEIAGLSNVKQVSAGSHSLAVTDDGRVYAWGANSSGQLGDGTTVNKSIPTEIAGLSNVKQVSAGSVYSLAVTDDGRVYAWGWNLFGQLGDGTTVDKNVPTRTLEPWRDSQIILSPSTVAHGTGSDSSFTTRTYRIPNLQPGEQVTVTLSGKVNRKSFESPVAGEGFVIGNQAFETFNETPRDTPTLPQPNLPAYNANNPWGYGKWTGNPTCTATENWVVPGDQCDQVWAQIEPTNQLLGSLSGYIWEDFADQIPLTSTSPMLVNVPVTLYKGTNGDFQSVAGTTLTDENGYYEFNNLVPGDDYYVNFAPVANPKVSVQGGTPTDLLQPGQSWVWTPDPVSNGPVKDRAMTDSSGVTTPNASVVANQMTENVNGAVRVYDTAISALKGTDTDEGFVQTVVRPFDEETEIKAIGKNTGTDNLKDLIFSDHNLEGDRVTWNSCTITDGNPASFDISGGTWDEDTDTYTVELPQTWVLRPGVDTLTCTGTLPAMGKAPEEDGYHKDEITFTGTGEITGVTVDDDSEFEATTTPWDRPVPNIILEKGILIQETTNPDDCADGEIFAQGACWLKDYTAQVGQTLDISFRMTNTGEEPLLDMSLDDRTTIGDATVENITCDFNTTEIDGLTRNILDKKASATCTGTLVIEDVNVDHKNEAIVWAVGQESGELASGKSDFKARTIAEPPVVTLPNAGGYSTSWWLLLAAIVAGVSISGFLYAGNKNRKSLGR